MAAAEAAAAAAKGRYREAAALNGAAGLLQPTVARSPTSSSAWSGRHTSAPRAALGNGEWDRLESAGRRLPLTQATKLAIASAQSLA